MFETRKTRNEAASRFDHSPPSVIRNCFGFRYSIFEFQIARLLPLVVIFCALQFSSTANTQTLPASPGNCSLAKKGKRLAKQHRNLLPDSSPKDLTDGDDSLDAASTEFSPRATIRSLLQPGFFLHTSSFSLTRSAGTVPAFLFPTHSSSDSLHEHIRERAPSQRLIYEKAFIPLPFRYPVSGFRFLSLHPRPP